MFTEHPSQEPFTPLDNRTEIERLRDDDLPASKREELASEVPRSQSRSMDLAGFLEARCPSLTEILDSVSDSSG